jgi:hypothetical protein
MVETKSICTVLALFLFSIHFFLSVDVFGFEYSTWDLGEDMHTNRTEITGEVLDDRIFVIGGADYQEDGAVDHLS